MKLSQKQQEIVDHLDGAILVKAGPGSGKTRVLTERVKHLLSAKRRAKVLALTFSNMAAEEMRERLESDPMVGDAIDRVTIGTIHSFCLEMVQSRGHLIGLRSDISLFENENDRLAILRSVISDGAWYSILPQDPKESKKFLRQCLNRIARQKRTLISPEFCSLKEPFSAIYQGYNDALQSQNAMDFDDVLFYSYRILVENPALIKLYNSVYRYICVDEAQDLNFAQYSVIRSLCGPDFQNIMMVGDENQSIYAFNGSSSKYMSECFVRDFSPRVYTLDENFRSAKAIIRFANQLMGNNEKDLSKYVYDGELSAMPYENELTEAQAVSEKIEALMLSGHRDIEDPLAYEDFAVIARNRYAFSQIEEVFKEKNLPYYYKRTPSGMTCETRYMEAFDLMLRLIMNPLDLYHRQMLVKLVSRERSYDLILQDVEIPLDQLVDQSEYAWLMFALEDISRDDVLNFDRVITSLRDNAPENLPDEERYLLEKDISEWEKHWKKYKSQVPRENRTLISFRNAISLGKTQEIDSDEGIALLTAHMSKGLEFEVVFIIGLSEGTFPDYRAVRSGEEAMRQETNNMYVAVTRAKRLCYLSYPCIKRMPWGDDKKQFPSRYILPCLQD